MRFRNFVVIVLILCIAASFNSASVNAKSLSQLQKEREAIRKAEQDAQRQLKEAKEQKDTLINEIEQLDIEIDNAEKELGYVTKRLEDAQVKLDEAKVELASAEDRRETYYESLKVRLRFLHENGKVGYMQVLMRSKTFGDFLNRAEYIKDIVEYDQRVYSDLKDVENVIAEKKDTMQQQVVEIGVLVTQQTEKKANLEQTQTRKQSAVDDIEKSEAKFAKNIKELEAQETQISAYIKKAQQTVTSTRGTGAVPNGKFRWPVDGYSKISSGYVNRTNPVTGRREFHTGIDIPAPRGTNILAAEAGTVIWASTRGGYGQCVMIDHGNGVSTLYGHNSKIVVSVGDQVSRGQVIAKCGSTGISTGNHCHFEVRINGGTVNPKPYVGL